MYLNHQEADHEDSKSIMFYKKTEATHRICVHSVFWLQDKKFHLMYTFAPFLRALAIHWRLLFHRTNHRQLDTRLRAELATFAWREYWRCQKRIFDLGPVDRQKAGRH